MDVRQAKSLCIQRVRFDEMTHLGDLSYVHGAQQVECRESSAAVVQRTQCDLSDDKRMDDDFSSGEELGHPGVGAPQMVDPHRSVGKNHSSSALVRLMYSRFGSEPPRAASLREASM